MVLDRLVLLLWAKWWLLFSPSTIFAPFFPCRRILFLFCEVLSFFWCWASFFFLVLPLLLQDCVLLTFGVLCLHWLCSLSSLWWLVLLRLWLFILYLLWRCRVSGRSLLFPLAAPICWDPLGSFLRLSLTVVSCRTLSFCCSSPGFLPLAFVQAWVWGAAVLVMDPPFFWGALFPLSLLF